MSDKLRAALEEILKGSKPTGRWLNLVTLDAIKDGEDEDVVPEGYYNTGSPPKEDDVFLGEEPPIPEGIRKQRWDEAFMNDSTPLVVGGKWLLPAEWEEYDKEEQDTWLETVVGICERALAE
jgi:hypothetical protein